MPKLAAGLYEQIISEATSQLIDELEGLAGTSRLQPGEIGDRLALYLGQLLMRVVAELPESERAERALELSRDMVALLNSSSKLGDLGDSPSTLKEYLSSVASLDPAGEKRVPQSPLTPLLDTTLLTNSPNEPRVGAQLLSEIESADRIDVVMAFVRRSGIRPFLEPLSRFIARSGKATQVRLLTTIYTGSTEKRALDELLNMGLHQIEWVD